MASASCERSGEEAPRAFDSSSMGPNESEVGTSSAAGSESGSGLICPKLRALIEAVAQGEVVGREGILTQLRPISELAAVTYSTIPEDTPDIYFSDIEVNLATAVKLNERNEVDAFAGAIENAKESCTKAGY